MKKPEIQRNRIYYADGRVEPLQMPVQLENLQELVGGWIEAVHLDDGLTLVVNEEGLIHNLPANQALAETYVPGARDGMIFGNAVCLHIEDL